MKSEACKQIEIMTKSDSPKVREMAIALLSPDRTPESMLKAWHKGMGVPYQDKVTPISIEDMERRLRLAMEEQVELIKAAGFTIVSKETGLDISQDLKIVPVEGQQQDLTLIGDGLCDVMVINTGTAVEMGMPLMALFVEGMLSNGTKLPPDGNTIFNRCTTKDTDSTHECNANKEDCALISPNDPIGKILKPKTYIKADFAGVLSGQINNECSK